MTVSLLIDALEPDREPGLLRFSGPVLCHVTTVGDRDVAVHFHFHRVEITRVVLLVLNSLKKAFPVVDEKRLASGCPGVTVGKGEIRTADIIDVSYVATHNGRLHHSFERQDFLGLRRNICGGGSRRAWLQTGRRPGLLAEYRGCSYREKKNPSGNWPAHGAEYITGLLEERGRRIGSSKMSLKRICWVI